MGIRKLAVAVALSVFVASGVVLAQGPAAHAAPAAPAAVAVQEEAAAEEAAEEAVVEEEVAPPEPVVAVILEPVIEEPAPVEAKPAAKPETKVDFYGNASYRFRGRLWSAEAKVGNDTKSGSSFDYLNLLGWSAGLKAKVDDQLSLQFQIGNDVNAGESVSWWNNKAPQGRGNGSGAYLGAADNLYVHLAYAAWNQGCFTLTGGVIPVVSNGTLDLLERSLSTGSYAEAIFQTWSTQLNNSLIALKLGVPIVKEGVKVGAELTYSILDPRTQKLISGSDAGLVKEEPNSNPTSNLFILDVPVAAGDLKVTPQFTYVLNRNFNDSLEQGDDELLVGLSASYKINDAVSVNLNGAYGTVSNENSLVGGYGSNVRSGSNGALTGPNKYASTGLIGSLGSTIKFGPGAFQVGVSYGNSFNNVDKYSYAVIKNDTTYKTIPGKVEYEFERDEDGNIAYDDNEEPIVNIISVVADKKEVDKVTKQVTETPVDAQKDFTNRNDILFDLRYTWNAHPKFTVVPRIRVYYSAYDEKRGGVKSKIETRPELILTGSF